MKKNKVIVVFKGRFELMKASKKPEKTDLLTILDDARHSKDKNKRLHFLSLFYDCVVGSKTFNIMTM